jgi:hypothetical protein
MWITFPLTAARGGAQIRGVMGDAPRLVGLSDARDHLWRARHELLTAGYGSWVGNLVELIDAIALEIEWLSSEDGDRGSPA